MKLWSLAVVPLLALSVAAYTRHAPPTTHRVRMVQQGTAYKFDPAALTIKVGDVVEFVNVSGGPHNVQFDPAHIPEGGQAFLMRAMTNRMSPTQMSSQMMQRPNEVYRISFAGAPAGTYNFFCLPHQALGMKGTLTVTR